MKDPRASAQIKIRPDLEEYADDHDRTWRAVQALVEAGDAATARSLAREAGLALDAHMAAEEEEEGVFTWLVAAQPELAPEVDRLAAEHAEIRELFAAFEAVSDAEVDALTRRLSARFQAHEAAERRVVEQIHRRR